MKKMRTKLVCLLTLCLLAVGINDYGLADDKSEAKGEICITLDDLPVVRVHDRIERLMITDEILYTLEEFGVNAAGFVVGNNIEGDYDILEAWLGAGHTLGNHTYSHPDLNEVPEKLYIEDIARGAGAIEDILTDAGQEKRYFRYPNLHYGRTYETKKAVREYLDKQGYVIAHVSVDTEDFVYNLQFEKISRNMDSLDYVRLGNEYIDHIMEKLEAAEKLSQEIMGRPIKHILLLHANRINAAFLYDLLSEISLRGYRFISLDRALTDPVYSTPEAYIGPKGLSYPERLSKTDPDMLPAREGPG